MTTMYQRTKRRPQGNGTIRATLLMIVAGILLALSI